MIASVIAISRFMSTIKRNENKIILKEILAEIMPKEFVYRRKQGFGAPLKAWLTEEIVKTELDRLIANEDHSMYRYLDRAEVTRIIEQRATLSKTAVQKIWSLLCLALWFELNQRFHE